jgi:integral membrane sensor domain MASE1
MPAIDSVRAIYYIDLPLMVVLISLVYSATRFDNWSAILSEAFRWGFRLVGFLVVIGVVLYVVNSI